MYDKTLFKRHTNSVTELVCLLKILYRVTYSAYLNLKIKIYSVTELIIKYNKVIILHSNVMRRLFLRSNCEYSNKFLYYKKIIFPNDIYQTRSYSIKNIPIILSIQTV